MIKPSSWSSAKSVAPVPAERHPDRAVSRRLALRRLAGWGTAGLLTACGLDEAQRPWQGAPFPAFDLAAPDGFRHHSRDYVGHPLLINFWATWCPPCRREMSDLETLHKTLSPKGLRLLAISVDTDLNLVREYIQQTALTFTILSDPGQAWSGTALAIPGFPTTYLVDRDGIILDALVGPRAWADAAMLTELSKRFGLADSPG